MLEQLKLGLFVLLRDNNAGEGKHLQRERAEITVAREFEPINEAIQQSGVSKDTQDGVTRVPLFTEGGSLVGKIRTSSSEI